LRQRDVSPLAAQSVQRPRAVPDHVVQIRDRLVRQPVRKYAISARITAACAAKMIE
jgi:hypothetical protein